MLVGDSTAKVVPSRHHEMDLMGGSGGEGAVGFLHQKGKGQQGGGLTCGSPGWRGPRRAPR